MNYNEFIKKHQEVILGGDITESYVDDCLDIIQEMAANLEKGMKSQLIRIFMHLLKYQFQPIKQSRSWINTIRSASNEINKIKQKNKSIWNVFGDDHLNDIYIKAVNEACKDTGLNIRNFPLQRPDYFTKENMADLQFIENYLRRYVYSDEAKDVLSL